MKEWGTAIIGKTVGFFGSGAMTGTTEITTLTKTVTVASRLELITEATFGFLAKAAVPVAAGGTAVDILAHDACVIMADPAAAFAFSQVYP